MFYKVVLVSAVLQCKSAICVRVCVCVCVCMSFSGGSDSKESACNVEDLGSIPGWGRSPGGGHDNPLL